MFAPTGDVILFATDDGGIPWPVIGLVLLFGALAIANILGHLLYKRRGLALPRLYRKTTILLWADSPLMLLFFIAIWLDWPVVVQTTLIFLTVAFTTLLMARVGRIVKEDDDNSPQGRVFREVVGRVHDEYHPKLIRGVVIFVAVHLVIWFDWGYVELGIAAAGLFACFHLFKRGRGIVKRAKQRGNPRSEEAPAPTPAPSTRPRRRTRPPGGRRRRRPSRK